MTPWSPLMWTTPFAPRTAPGIWISISEKLLLNGIWVKSVLIQHDVAAASMNTSRLRSTHDGMLRSRSASASRIAMLAPPLPRSTRTIPTQVAILRLDVVRAERKRWE